ncbi:MAG: DUF6578 domain-containing protein [Mycobacteriales bacterium]
MRLTVWVESWQHECCGDPFSIGSQVNWTLTDTDLNYVAEHFTPDATVMIDRREVHHGELPDDAPVTTGVVASIHAVHTRYAPDPNNDRVSTTVPGSGKLTELHDS